GAEVRGDAVRRGERPVHAGYGGGGRRQRAGAVEPGRDRVVGELRLVADGGPIDPGFLEDPSVDDELDDQREPGFVRVERREVRRKALRHHRKDHAAGVHGGRVVAGGGVDGRALLHDRVDVGDGDEDLHVAAGHLLGDGQLIEVLRVVVVDRAPEKRREVADRRVALGRGAGQRVDLL